MEASAQSPKVQLTDVIYPFDRIWKFLLANIGVGIMITFIFGVPDDLGRFVQETFWSTIFSLTQWTGHAYISSLIGRRVSWLERPWLRAILAVLSMTIYTVVAFVVVSLIIHYFVFGKSPDDLWYWIVKASRVPMIVAFVIGWGMAARGFYVSWKESEIRSRKLEVEMLTYRYEALRNQINPHFLFNSFNVLSDLVYEDQDMAVKFIRQLSDLYRYVLDSRERETVALQEELDFAQGFIFLLETRFEDKLQIEMEVEAKPGEAIVPMTLQLLLENAVKHNMATRKKPLWIKVHREGDVLHVRNGLQRRNVGDDSKKIGLKNLEQQYGHLSDGKLEVGETETEFWVRIPILKTELA
jgi:two-component system LytT family sensor kinase